MRHLTPGAMIAAATLTILTGMWMDRPMPIKHTPVDYCWIDLYAGHGEWYPSFGLCADQDIYRDI